MKRLMTTMILMLLLATLPMLAFAMSHEDHEKGKSGDMMHQGHTSESHGDMMHEDKGMHEGHDKMGHDDHEMKHEKMDHGDHAGMSGMQDIGAQTDKGVKCAAMVKAYDPKMAEMANATHHFMVNFTDENGQPITNGKVAVKVKSHEGEASKPIMLMPMGDGYGGDLKLDKGHYKLEVGTKLEDGKKRKFEYDYMVK